MSIKYIDCHWTSNCFKWIPKIYTSIYSTTSINGPWKNFKSIVFWWLNFQVVFRTDEPIGVTE